MHKALAVRLVKRIKEKLPAIDITAGEAALITIITLSTMAGFLHERTDFNSARILRYARDNVKKLSESDIQGEG